MQHIQMGPMPLQFGYPGIKTPIQRVQSNRSSQKLPAPKKDRVRFGKIENLTGPIPPKSVVILVPGMFGPVESMRPLGEYLKRRGHTTHVLQSPFNAKAGSTYASTNWLTHNIDRIRLDESSDRYVSLLKEMEQVPKEQRVDFLRSKFGLKNDEMGRAAAKAALGVIFKANTNYEEETDFTHLLLRLRQERKDLGGVLPPEATHKQLFSLSTIARKSLETELQPAFLKPGGDVKKQAKALEKTIDHVMDQITPRVVLVGHSMGGFVSMLSLFEQMHDTAMVVGLAAPGENGTDVIPAALGVCKMLPEVMQQKGRQFVEWLGPGIAHMVQGSAATEKLKADHQPFNTSVFAVGLPGDTDGIVGEKNFRMNDQLPGRVNVIVTPKPGYIVQMASGGLHQLHQLLRWNPLFAWAEDRLINSTKFIEGTAYHCGPIQFQDQYWPQEGDIVQNILRAPKNDQGQFDYQAGKPNYNEAVQQLRRVIDPFQYEAERIHFLNVLQDTLADARKEKTSGEYQEMLEAYLPLKPHLEAISQEAQPIENGVADKAKALLNILSEVENPAQDNYQEPLPNTPSLLNIVSHAEEFSSQPQHFSKAKL